MYFVSTISPQLDTLKSNLFIVNTNFTIVPKVSGNYAGTKWETILRECLTSVGRIKWLNKNVGINIKGISGNRYCIGRIMFVDAIASALSLLVPYVDALYIVRFNYGGWNFTYSSRAITEN